MFCKLKKNQLNSDDILSPVDGSKFKATLYQTQFGASVRIDPVEGCPSPAWSGVDVSLASGLPRNSDGTYDTDRERWFVTVNWPSCGASSPAAVEGFVEHLKVATAVARKIEQAVGISG